MPRRIVLVIGVAVVLCAAWFAVRHLATPEAHPEAAMPAPPAQPDRARGQLPTKPLQVVQANKQTVSGSASVSGHVYFDAWQEGDGQIDVGVSVLKLDGDQVVGSTSKGWAKTDPGGEYEFRDLVPGTYWVRAMLHGSATRQQIELAPGDTKTGIDLTIESTGTSLSGRVLDPDGNPIEGAAVCLLTGMATLYTVGETVSDARGQYIFRHLAASAIGPAGYHLSARKPGHKAQNEFLAVRLEEKESRTGVDIVLMRGLFTVSGQVHSDSGQAVGGVAIVADQERAESDDNGAFTLTLVSPCAVVLELKPESEWCSFSPAQFLFDGTADASGVDFTLVEGGAVTGVFETHDGEDFDARGIRTDDGRDIIRTAASDGWRTWPSGTVFRFEGVTPGSRRLFVGVEDRIHAPYLSEPFAVRAGETTDIGIVQITGGGGMRGRVTDEDGKPAEARIELFPQHAEYKSRLDYGTSSNAEADGIYTIDHVMPGTYRVTVARQKDSAQSVTIKDGETLTLDLKVPRRLARHREDEKGDAVLEGVVTWDDGSPAAGLDWRVERARGTTDEQGRIRVEGLAAGREYEVGVSTPLDRYEKRCRPGDDLRIVCVRTTKVRCRLIYRDSGELIGHATFVAFRDGERKTWPVDATRGATGEFHFEFLPPGPIAVFGDDFASLTLDSAAMQPGADVNLGTIRVDPGLTIHGTATNDQGVPAGSATIWVAPIATPDRWSAIGGREVVADSNGTFTIEHVVPGPYRIQATAQGCASLISEYTLVAGVQLVLVLPRSGRVVCEVSSPSHDRRFVRLDPTDDARTDTYKAEFPAGRTAIAIEGVQPGDYNVSFSDISQPLVTTVGAGETVVVRFD